MYNISDEFYNALPKTGSYVYEECECGKIHYISPEYSNGWDDDEWEIFVKNAEDLPNNKKYEEFFEEDCIPCVNFNGNTYVVTYSCGLLKEIEKLIWNNRYSILDFYNNKEKSINTEIQKLNQKMKYLNVDEKKYITVHCEVRGDNKSDSSYYTLDAETFEKAIEISKPFLIKEMTKHGYKENVLTFSAFYTKDTKKLFKVEFYETDPRL